MPESENALWAKTRRNMAAPRRRTERSESAAERACKAPPPHRQPPHFHPAPPKLCAKQICAHSWHEERTAETLPNRPHRFPRPADTLPCRFFVHRFCARRGAKRRAPPGAPFLKGRHKFICANDNIALRGGKSPRAVPRFCGRLLEKNKRGKTPRPNS